MPREVFLALASEPQEAILRESLQAHGVTVDCLPLGAHLETAAQQATRGTAAPLLLIDLAVLAQLHTSAEAFCTWQRSYCAAAKLVLCCAGLHAVPPLARAWARELGALDLLPGCDLAHSRASLRPTLKTLLALLDGCAVDDAATEQALRALPRSVDRSTRIAQAWDHLDELRALGLAPATLAAAIAGGVDIRARQYRARTYEDCFVGAALVEWLMQTAHLTRADALRAGQALLALGDIYHVARAQPFRDGHFFYRVRAQTPALEALNLCQVIAHMRSELPIRDRKYHGTLYPGCFAGADATAWMKKTLALNENEAMTLGELLLELFVIHHVLDDHHFRDGKYFFRFFEDET
jgi:Domain found in Dishevelled, Egl-10, and Pleckstrin (DEP)